MARAHPSAITNLVPASEPARTAAADGRNSPLQRLLVAAGELASTIAITEELAQQRADLLLDTTAVRPSRARWTARRPNLVPLAEAAERSNRHPEVLRRWCVEGRIPAVRVGRTWAITTETLAQLVQHRGRSRPRLVSPPPT